MSLNLAKTNIAASFAFDLNKAENGVWMPLTLDIKVKVRRFKSRVSQDARNKFMQPYAQVARRGQELPENITNEVLNKQLAAGVIVDWKGIVDADGNEIACTFDNALELLTQLPDFRDAIFQLSIDAEAFKPDSEEGVKN